MSRGISVVGAQFIGNWCGTLLYGAFVVTCVLAAQTLFIIKRGRVGRLRRLDEINWLLVFCAAAFFILITLDLILATYHHYVAFVLSGGPDGALKEFSGAADWASVARCICVFLTMQLGDFILIYRCWIVYARRWLIIVPSIAIFLTGFALGIRSVQLTFVMADSPNLVVLGSEVALLSLVIFVLATVQNIVSTGLLVFRIWRVDHDIEEYVGGRHTSHLRKVTIVIMESGAFYTTAVLLCLIMDAIHSNGFYPMTRIVLVSAGIAFNAILIRTSANRDERFKSYNEQSTFRAAEGPTSTTSISSGFTPSHTENPYDLSTARAMKAEKDSASESTPSV